MDTVASKLGFNGRESFQQAELGDYYNSLGSKHGNQLSGNPDSTPSPGTSGQGTPESTTPNPGTPGPGSSKQAISEPSTPSPGSSGQGTPESSTPSPDTPGPGSSSPDTPGPGSSGPSTPSQDIPGAGSTGPSTSIPGTPGPGSSEPGTSKPSTPSPGTSGQTTPIPGSQQQTQGQAKPPYPSSQKALVTGGGGYFGFSLGSSLVRKGVSVVLLDIQHPKWELPKGVAFIQADIRDGEALYQACEGVDCVFHVASYGMSGAEKLHKEQIESVNIGGTKIVIDVCIKRQIPRLVYTSTVNVVFGGKPIVQGDEDSVPYFPLEKHIDHYSRTKAVADQMILTCNGTPLPGGGTLRTCVLRPPGIYGPEEQRHLPRVAGSIRKRLFTFKFGDPRTRMNWVHVQNLVQAHILAAEALTANKKYIASGQAYYINDGESVNLFEWMSPLFDKMGYSRPWIQIPTSLAYLSASGMEYLHLALKPICDFPPLLTRSEVWSIAVTHTFQIRKARDHLGYTPEKFAFADSVDHYIQTWHKQQRHSPRFLRLLMVLICLLGTLLLSLSLLDPSFLGLSHGNYM
ncbi:LOW QUALITY PROTEIN: putative short-chain dehydrogenase/reductase family 42E member 2 [Sarcophilus harrisii]|uniref:LOW QUALITY PROTEIN: putative short-chain dehydrogenase/reductase family 42E member 2 n=1 Tax=Sarcophilus harrisii TaxID=9305 RepID=UPI001301F4CD|nr:LOW QUALITY PROTEIN: putative short-chain dehydrogenase/reductase family 42E member 2 [Sarcophilus harrisii]